MDLLVECQERQGLLQGPAFVDVQGKEVTSGKYEALILGALQDHQHWEGEQEDDFSGPSGSSSFIGDPESSRTYPHSIGRWCRSNL